MPHLKTLVRMVEHVVPMPEAVAVSVQTELDATNEVVGGGSVIVPHVNVQLSSDHPYVVHLKHKVLEEKTDNMLFYF